MTEPFKGTQAQLADELERLAAANRKNRNGDEKSDFMSTIYVGRERAYQAAAALVRNAIITEPKQ